MTDEVKKEIKCLKEKIEMNKFMEFIYLNKEQVKIIENLFKEIEYNDKKWENKIKAKIVECREILYSFEKELELKDKFIYKESLNCLLGQISILQSLLEEEE